MEPREPAKCAKPLQRAFNEVKYIFFAKNCQAEISVTESSATSVPYAWEWLTSEPFNGS